VYRPGINVVDFDAGYRQARIWSEHNLRSYQWRFDYLDPTDDEVVLVNTFFQNVALGATPFWIIEPISKQHQGLLCGPLADGTRTTFPLPINGTASGVTVFVDGVPQESSAYTIHGCANIVGDDTGGDDAAICEDATKFSCTSATDAAVAFGIEGLGSLAITPSANPSNVFPNAYAGVTAAEEYTAVAAMLETKASVRNALMRIYWYISAGNPAAPGSSPGSGVAMTQGSWLVFSHTGTASGSSTLARPAAEVDSTSNEKWYADALALCPGDYDRWHLPSQAPNLIEFTSAPADGARVTAAATGYGMARVRLNADEMSMEETGEGLALPVQIRMYEEVELYW
jgi:hypothetical protein